ECSHHWHPLLRRGRCVLRRCAARSLANPWNLGHSIQVNGGGRTIDVRRSQLLESRALERVTSRASFHCVFSMLMIELSLQSVLHGIAVVVLTREKFQTRTPEVRDFNR